MGFYNYYWSFLCYLQYLPSILLICIMLLWESCFFKFYIYALCLLWMHALSVLCLIYTRLYYLDLTLCRYTLLFEHKHIRFPICVLQNQNHLQNFFLENWQAHHRSSIALHFSICSFNKLALQNISHKVNILLDFTFLPLSRTITV